MVVHQNVEKEGEHFSSKHIIVNLILSSYIDLCSFIYLYIQYSTIFFIFTRIPSGRENDWMQRIESSYPSVPVFTKQIFVCDLHFDDNEIVLRGSKKCLISGATPKVMYA